MADAATWQFSYAGLDGGTPVSASGVITTDSSTPLLTFQGASGWGPAATGYDVVSISGTRTEGGLTQQIVGLIGGAGYQQTVWPPASPSPGWIYDNVVYWNSGAPGVALADSAAGGFAAIRRRAGRTWIARLARPA